MSVEAEQLEITSPCPITLDRSAVSAKDKSMFCAHCSKDVHLLSQMTEREARDLMKTEAGRDICVSYATRTDGSIRFRDEAPLVPVTALRRRPVPVPAVAVTSPPRRLSLVASLGACMLLAACTAHGEPEIVGGLEAPPVIEDVAEPELIEEVPCEPEHRAVAGGLQAQPLPEPPELLVDGGLRAEPLPEPEPPIKVTRKPPKITKDPSQHMRGGLRARPISDREDPLGEI